MGFFPHTRDLTTYPVGFRRWWLLIMASCATLITSFEGQVGPVVSLVLDDLNISLTTWGLMTSGTAVVGILVGVIAGPLSDRIGRVRLLVPALFITTAACFAIALATDGTEMFILRVIQRFTEGFAVATTAPLIRDYSPRTGRALGYGLWNLGPDGAAFIGAGVAAVTLPMFSNGWQSQFIMQGSLSLILAILIAITIRDLSPQLRAQILANVKLAGAAEAAAANTRVARPRYTELMRHPVIWVHCVGITMWLLFYQTLTGWGQYLLSANFGLSAADASEVMTGFWILDLILLVLTGWISDRLQLRKPFIIVGSLGLAFVAFYFASLIGTEVSQGQLFIIAMLSGIPLGMSYSAWMANYSENVEDINPRLQGTAWAIYYMCVGLASITFSYVTPAVVEAFDGQWTVWLIICGVGQLIFSTCVFFFKGPWRRSTAVRRNEELRNELLAAAEGAPSKAPVATSPKADELPA